jgi:hypothetical protein
MFPWKQMNNRRMMFPMRCVPKGYKRVVSRVEAGLNTSTLKQFALNESDENGYILCDNTCCHRADRHTERIDMLVTL